ncbi:PilZ domain-containing protein [Candidatus Nitrospira bockiana]
MESSHDPGTTDNALSERAVVIRKYPRYGVQLPISFSVGNVEGDGTISNLSLGGCRFESDIELARGDYARLRIYIAMIEPPVIVESAAVRWASGKDCGVEFLAIAPGEKERLRRFLDSQGGW